MKWEGRALFLCTAESDSLFRLGNIWAVGGGKKEANGKLFLQCKFGKPEKVEGMKGFLYPMEDIAPNGHTPFPSPKTLYSDESCEKPIEKVPDGDFFAYRRLEFDPKTKLEDLLGWGEKSIAAHIVEKVFVIQAGPNEGARIGNGLSDGFIVKDLIEEK
jgi:hypothetical protein